MSDPGDELPSGKPRIVTRSVTFESVGTSDGSGVMPVAVCPRRVALLPVAQCAACPDFVSLCVNPDSGSPFMVCSFDDAPFARASVDGCERPPELRDGHRQCIADVMTALTPKAAIALHAALPSPVLMVASEASIGQVAATMAYEGVHVVLVLNAAAEIIGSVSTLDLTRWLACRLGYVVPASSSDSRP